MLAKFQVIRTRLDRLFDRKRNLRVYGVLRLESDVKLVFDVVLSVPKVGTSLNDVLGLVGMFG